VKTEFERLSNDTLAIIKGFGIKSRTVFKMHRQTCQRLNTYLEENDLEFSLENGHKWLSEALPREPMTHHQQAVHSSRWRTVSMLAECQAGVLDSWRVYRKTPAARPETARYLKLLHLHEQRLQTEGMAKATIDFSMRVDSDFLIFLEKTGISEIGDITPHDVARYFADDKFAGRKPDGVKAYAYKLRSFLVFLEETGAMVGKKLSLAVPKVFAKQVSIVTVLSEKASTAIRNGDAKPETDTAARDHAIILLALRSGLRRSDILKLKLSDIDWNFDSISLTQQKTSVPITLPLLPDVGNAIMEYILKYRPQAASDTVFLRHYAPHRALTPLSSAIPSKYLSAFEPEDCPQRGYHILRRTLSTRMLRNNIPRSVISASIGQTTPNSVDVYLSADEENMRKCALPLKGIECERGDLQ